MIAVPGDTPATTIAAIIADEAAIGMINAKTTAVRIIPAPGRDGGGGRRVRGAARHRAGHGGAPVVERGVHRPRRPHPGALAGAGQLASGRGSSRPVPYQPKRERARESAWWIERSWSLRTITTNASSVRTAATMTNRRFIGSSASLRRKPRCSGSTSRNAGDQPAPPGALKVNGPGTRAR